MLALVWACLRPGFLNAGLTNQAALPLLCRSVARRRADVCFLPANLIARHLPPDQLKNAAGLYNLMLISRAIGWPRSAR